MELQTGRARQVRQSAKPSMLEVMGNQSQSICVSGGLPGVRGHEFRNQTPGG